MSQNNSDSDEILVEQFQSGNLSALPELVQRWHKEFCNKAYWLTKDKDLSKDIAQDCWKIIIDKLKDLKEPKSFRSWALRIVYSKSLDALRDIQRKRNELKVFAINQTDVDEESIDDSDLKRNLLKQINELPEPQQVVLKLFYTENYSLKEIGKLLNISVGTAKSRLFHAREKLKMNIKK
jgi:RNA polymerase sigma-70 factor (ECF subfamily)